MENEKDSKKHIELEFKYKVAPESIFAYKNLMEKEFTIIDMFFVSGPDYYFVKDGTDEFIRFRKADYQSENGELTIKQKTVDKNNFNRVEVNIGLKNPKIEDVLKFSSLLGFDFDFKITKDCLVFETPECVSAFYSARQDDGKSLYFIEIEVKEEIISTLSEEEAWQLLLFYEKKLSPLGISPQNRIKKSLFETFRTKKAVNNV